MREDRALAIASAFQKVEEGAGGRSAAAALRVTADRLGLTVIEVFEALVAVARREEQAEVETVETVPMEKVA